MKRWAHNKEKSSVPKIMRDIKTSEVNRNAKASAASGKELGY